MSGGIHIADALIRLVTGTTDADEAMRAELLTRFGAADNASGITCKLIDGQFTVHIDLTGRAPFTPIQEIRIVELIDAALEQAFPTTEDFATIADDEAPL